MASLVSLPAQPRATPAWIIVARLVAVVAGLTCAAQSVHSAEWKLAQLMQALEQRGAERATFVERKFIALLDKPLESSGELLYVPPARLEKRTLKPKPESVVLDGGTLTIERGKQKHSLRLQDYPDIAAFIESIRGTLAGDRKALERVFRLELHGTENRWTLVMFPSDAKLAATVLRIDVTGTRDLVRSVETLQTDGDRSVLTVERGTGAAGSAKPAPR